jgi:hypothetical protein
MSDSNPTAAPNAAPEAPTSAKVFGYDVAAQAKLDLVQKPNPNSPLAAG